MSTSSRAWRGARADWKLHALSVFSLAVAFVCLASALLVVANLDNVRNRWSRAGRASVFLREGTSEAMVAEMKQALEQTPGIASARYVSQADARKDMVGENADSTMSALPAEAFPASIEIEVASTVSESELGAITAKLQKIPSVESVETYQRYTENLKGLLYAGVAASGMLALIVFSAVVSVVASTVRLSLQRRHVEIEVLRLVGATEQYVRSPFVLEGCAQGAMGAAASIAMLGVLYLVVRDHIHEVSRVLVGVPPTFLPWYAVVGLIGLGALLGASASHVSLKRMTTV